MDKERERGTETDRGRERYGLGERKRDRQRERDGQGEKKRDRERQREEEIWTRERKRA